MNRIQAHPAAVGAGTGVVIVFVWNILVPQHPMPAEVAAGAAPIVGQIFRWLVAWLPEPSNGGQS